MKMNQDLNKIAFNNTIADIAAKVELSRNPVKQIASECEFFASQIEGDEYKRVFAALGKCKTRKAMSIIINSTNC